MLASNVRKRITQCGSTVIYHSKSSRSDAFDSPFVILVFSSVLLVGMLMGSIALLYTVGETELPSTLTLAIGGHMKRD